MNIIRAAHLGMCFGVRDAIELASRHADSHPLTILGELVHNETVNADLRSRGVAIEQQLDHVATPAVMITAHGASRRAIASVRARGHDVIEATCPLVHFAHRALMEMVWDGLHPVIIGKRDHVEVRGLTGDLDAFDVILDDEDIETLQERLRFGVVSQTTQPIERVRRLVGLIRERFPQSEVRFRDTVCQPTKLRQSAAIELAQRCDVVIVIGGEHSNNTRELAETCRAHCERVFQVQDAIGLRRYWFYNAGTIGLTAGTSTPDAVILAVEDQLRAMIVEPLHTST